ncbi:pseudoazurin (plasmid) [Paracoccus versutus]|jgi:pseudoazurin|uniref:Pseudoazurin n=1 Tax=Paracoccus versutus TaxID=34007 RepID=A0A3E0BST3_PARVE|nr:MULTISPECIES: pseudoazurin [Paracoccus]KGJ09874.1 pseudoazurin [Paracoccus versutus]MBT0782103.1 pseudoazurin [Paracoccus sp. pheM1]MCJ1901263.1 pseudoazurin [Paracoccus versutus]MDF3905899.1 pseudoazurin [Paracoccus sp. AS002]REF72172.1 pseudoazurin [Paracoccus versutus]
MFHNSLAAAAAALLALAAPAFAATHEVHMLNKGESGAMVFEPAFVRAEPGDVINFVPTDKSHNVEAIKEILPEGVETFKSKINESYTLTVTEPGLYGVKCTPHFGMGMVGLVQVGEAPDNLDAAKTAKMPKKARERMDAELAQVN